jgi:hypothetical protein
MRCVVALIVFSVFIIRLIAPSGRWRESILQPEIAIHVISHRQ